MTKKNHIPILFVPFICIYIYYTILNNKSKGAIYYHEYTTPLLFMLYFKYSQIIGTELFLWPCALLESHVQQYPLVNFRSKAF